MTPDYLESLRDVVQQAIDEGSLGAPRYLRCVAADPGRKAASRTPWADWATSPRHGSAPSRVSVYRLGGSGAVYVTDMQQWPYGSGRHHHRIPLAVRLDA